MPMSTNSSQAISAPLPESLVNAIEAQTGGRLTVVKLRAGGGVSRQGAEIRIDVPGALPKLGYLSYDTRGSDPNRMAHFRRECAVLRALSGPLATSGVRVPAFIAADESNLALITELVAGETQFNHLKEEEREVIAEDFMKQLARLHAIDIANLNLDGFPSPAATSVLVRARIAQLRAENMSSVPDPILILVLKWLDANVPPDPPRTVLVHGDAGVGNFLYIGRGVSALLDWELTHYGDPMEDLAQIWVRMLFQPFVPLAKLFAAYERATGDPVDLRRVRYHRLLFQASFTVGAHTIAYAPDAPAPAIMGLHMIFYTAHMRVMVQALAEATSVVLPPVSMPPARISHYERSFDIAINDLSTVITPRTGDAQASAKAKGLARLVKWWRNVDRYGAVFNQEEVTEVGGALGLRFDNVLDARRALAQAVLEGTIDDGAAIQLCHRRMARETMLMADAMGLLATTYYPPLA